jgi:hypothetical protein
MKFRAKLQLLLTTLLLSISLLEASEIVGYELPDSTAVNAPFTLKYTISKSSSQRVILEKPKKWYGALKVDSLGENGDDTTTALLIHLTAFASPVTKIPTFKVLVLPVDSTDTTAIDTITTDSLSIIVTSQFTVSTDSIVSANFSDPMRAGKFPIGRVLLTIGGLILLLVLIALLVYWIRSAIMRRQNRDFWGNKIPEVPPYDEAISALQRVKESTLSEDNELRGAVFSLSEILKRYIGRRYSCNIQESTSTEFQRWIRKNRTFTLEQKNVLEKFISETEPIKFANLVPKESDIERFVEDILMFVEETKPEEEKEER